MSKVLKQILEGKDVRMVLLEEDEVVTQFKRNMQKSLDLDDNMNPISRQRKTHKCIKCGAGGAYYKEIHPDTDMNEMVDYCPSCKTQFTLESLEL